MLTVYTLGTKLLDFLEIIHGAGYVHNNIYLDKVLLGSNQRIEYKKNVSIDYENQLEGKSLHIIDFTSLTPYIDHKTGKHLKQERIQSDMDIKNIC